MEFLGIKFAPLNIPLERRLQTLAAGSWFYIMALGGLSGLFLALFLIIFTDLRISVLLYVLWSWTIDTDTCERGGRTLNWVRNLKWWTYMRDYFPMKLEKLPGAEFDPKRNYLLCAFPHGMLSTGSFLAFATNACNIKEVLPGHTPHLITLQQHFGMPFFRELIYSLGLCSSSVDSINWLLKYPGGGKAAVLIVGGAAEAFYCKPGQYRLALKNRKGFIKLAMQNGIDLVPVFSFGETNIFDQVNNPKGSLLRTIQEWVKSAVGIAPIIPVGRGFLQYSFGWVPQRRPITTIIGQPVQVKHTEHPIEEEVDAMHAKFVDCLTELFEKHKHRFVENADKTSLVIE